MLFIVHLLLFASTINGLRKHNPELRRIVVRLTNAEHADTVAAEHGYVNLGSLDALPDYHLFEEIVDRKREVSRVV
jgi:hypothetical protein